MVALKALRFLESITSVENPMAKDGRGKGKSQSSQAAAMKTLLDQMFDDPDGAYALVDRQKLETSVRRALVEMPAKLQQELAKEAKDREGVNFFGLLKVESLNKERTVTGTAAKNAEIADFNLKALISANSLLESRRKILAQKQAETEDGEAENIENAKDTEFVMAMAVGDEEPAKVGKKRGGAAGSSNDNKPPSKAPAGNSVKGGKAAKKRRTTQSSGGDEESWLQKAGSRDRFPPKSKQFCNSKRVQTCTPRRGQMRSKRLPFCSHDIMSIGTGAKPVVHASVGDGFVAIAGSGNAAVEKERTEQAREATRLWQCK